MRAKQCPALFRINFEIVISVLPVTLIWACHWARQSLPLVVSPLSLPLGSPELATGGLATELGTGLARACHWWSRHRACHWARQSLPLGSPELATGGLATELATGLALIKVPCNCRDSGRLRYLRCSVHRCFLIVVSIRTLDIACRIKCIPMPRQLSYDAFAQSTLSTVR